MFEGFMDNIRTVFIYDMFVLMWRCLQRLIIVWGDIFSIRDRGYWFLDGPKISNFLYENHQGSLALTLLKVLNPKGVGLSFLRKTTLLHYKTKENHEESNTTLSFIRQKTGGV